MLLYPACECVCACVRVFTIEKDQEDTGIRELLSAEQVDVLHAQVEGQFDDGPVLHVCGDVCHQGQVLHQATSLEDKQTQR